MRTLEQSLQKADIEHLRIVASLWGLELESNDTGTALGELCASLLDLEAVTETLGVLPVDARSALNALIDGGGRIEWPAFARKFGEIREMGAGKRDRERPHLNPASVTEALYYRALIAKAFFDTDKGAQEFAYIPEDLLEIIEHQTESEPERIKSEPLGRPATPVEKAFEIPATDRILDDATTFLAALRIGENAQQARFKHDLQSLLEITGLVKDSGLHPDAVKKFLETSRSDSLSRLYTSWLNSTVFDELRLLPGIVCEGEWKNQPQVTREFLMNLIGDIPQRKWWSISAFVKAIKEKFPDFQRPAGDYDSWFIKREADGAYLRGFAYWDAVDGALVKYIIQLLHYLGRVDLASPEDGKEATAFRIFEWKVESGKSDKEGKIIITSNGRIAIPRMFSRAVRYQLARFCEWDEPKGDDYLYRVTAESLKRATEQGLKAEQLLAMLVKYTNGAVPPALVKGLKRWDAHGPEARVESLFVLRVSSPEVMEEIRRSKGEKFLGELLSPTTVVVHSGAIQKVLAELAELGLLAEIHLNE